MSSFVNSEQLVIETKIIVCLWLGTWHIWLVCMMIHKLKCVTPKPEIIKSIVFCILFFLIGGCIAWTLHGIGLFIFNDEWDLFINKYIIIFVCIEWISFIISYTSGYMLIASYLYYCLDNTHKKWIFYIHAINIFIIDIVSIFAMITWHIWNNHALSMLLLAINLIPLIIGACNLLYLFIKHLVKLTMLNIKQDKTTLNNKHSMIISLITRITVLSLINSTLGIFVAISATLVFIFNSIKLFTLIFWCIFGASCMSVTISFYMMLSINKGMYTFWCTKCDKKAKQICTNHASKTLERKRSHNMDTLEHNNNNNNNNTKHDPVDPVTITRLTSGTNEKCTNTKPTTSKPTILKHQWTDSNESIEYEHRKSLDQISELNRYNT